ncbi:MAG TPA: AI-2E family transporter, partial [Marinobacter adhaerens]|nr:AI-2E family transporter [Marinobacter adhaerens]
MRSLHGAGRLTVFNTGLDLPGQLFSRYTGFIMEDQSTNKEPAGENKR